MGGRLAAVFDIAESRTGGRRIRRAGTEAPPASRISFFA
jgi:hypothetical protein